MTERQDLTDTILAIDTEMLRDIVADYSETVHTRESTGLCSIAGIIDELDSFSRFKEGSSML